MRSQRAGEWCLIQRGDDLFIRKDQNLSPQSSSPWRLGLPLPSPLIFFPSHYFRKILTNSSGDTPISRNMAWSVPRGISLPWCRDTTVRLPSACANTKCALPLSACSKNPSCFNTRISSLSFIIGSLGIHAARGFLFQRSSRSKRNCCNKLKPIILWHIQTIHN